MADKKTAVQEEAQTQAISPADMAAGLQHEREIAVAQAILDSKIQGQQIFVGQLFERYGVDPSTHVLKSWLSGFEPIEDEA